MGAPPRAICQPGPKGGCELCAKPGGWERREKGEGCGRAPRVSRLLGSPWPGAPHTVQPGCGSPTEGTPEAANSEGRKEGETGPLGSLQTAEPGWGTWGVTCCDP